MSVNKFLHVHKSQPNKVMQINFWSLKTKTWLICTFKIHHFTQRKDIENMHRGRRPQHPWHYETLSVDRGRGISICDILEVIQTLYYLFVCEIYVEWRLLRFQGLASLGTTLTIFTHLYFNSSSQSNFNFCSQGWIFYISKGNFFPSKL
jgi:hypothetical protein